MMIIRPAIASDAPAIATIHITSWHETYAGIIPASYLSRLKVDEKAKLWTGAMERGQRIFVAEVDGRVVGFAYAAKTRDKESPYPGELYTLYVLKAHHKQGLGRQLFDHAQSLLAQQSLLPFVTHVLADNPALGFYQHMGAKITGEHIEDFDGCKLNELQLLWD